MNSISARIAAVLIFVFVHSCSGKQRPNILLVTIDTLRADHLRCYGYPRAETPVIDALAERGALFEQAVAHAPQTLPSHTSILTGLLPFEHGVRVNLNFSLPENVPTLGTLLRSAGYRTGAVVASSVLDSRFGLDRGFDRYNDDDMDSGPDGERRAPAVTRGATAWLSGRDKRPFFLWVHYYDPHGIYAAPSPFGEAYQDAPYDGEIAFTDLYLGMLLNRIGALSPDRETLIVFTSDHGEGLGDHGELFHSHLIYDSVMHVPLIIVPPGGLEEPVRVPHQVRSIDIAPTILDYAGVETGPGMSGESLRPAVESRETSAADRPAYMETYAPYYSYGWSYLLGLRRGKDKLIAGPARELYDLKRDPAETRNIYTSGGRAAALEAELKSTIATSGRRHETSPEPLDPEMEQKLLALGYVSAPLDTPPAAEAELPAGGADPKKMIAVANAIGEAGASYQMNRPREAISLLERVLPLDPDNGTLLLLLAHARYKAGQNRQAIAAYRRALEVSPESTALLNNLALLEEKRGRLDEAMKLLLRCRKIAPRFFESVSNLARLHSKLGNLDEAEALYLEAIRIRPDNPVPHLNLGNVYVRKQDDRRAAYQFQAALRLRAGGNAEVAAKARNNLLFLAQKSKRREP